MGRERHGLCEEDAGGEVDGDSCGRGGEDAGFAVARKDGYFVAELFCDEEEAIVWRDDEVAGFLTFERGAAEEGEVAIGGDGVGQEFFSGSAVAGVEEASGGIEDDFSSAVVDNVSTGWERGGCGEEGKGSGGGVPTVEGDGGVEFVDAVRVFAVGVEGGVARAGAGGCLEEGWIVGGKFGSGGVELVDHDAIGAEVVDEGEAVVGGDDDAVGVGGFLAGLDGAVAGELDVRDEFAELAVDGDCAGDYGAGTVVGGDEAAAGMVDDSVDAVAVGVGDGVEEVEVARCGDAVGVECTGFGSGLNSGEEEARAAVIADGEKAGSSGARDEAEIGERAGFWVPASYVDTVFCA